MIVRDTPSVWILFFVLRGSIAWTILPQIIGVALIAAVVVWLHEHFPQAFPAYSTAPFALLGVALSLFLGFRNNACYERWWEARQQWGQLLVDCRSIARMVQSYPDPDKARQDRADTITRGSIAFAYALKHQMRKSDPWPDLERLLPERLLQTIRGCRNPADRLLQRLEDELAGYLREGALTDVLVRAADDRLTSMATVQAACERIHNTRLPYAYGLLVQRTVYIYCLLLPFGLAEALGMTTPLACAIVAYTFFGLDALSAELGEPFGKEPNHLALDAMTRGIEIDLLDTLGETGLPEPLAPVNHQLT